MLRHPVFLPIRSSWSRDAFMVSLGGWVRGGSVLAPFLQSSRAWEETKVNIQGLLLAAPQAFALESYLTCRDQFAKVHSRSTSPSYDPGCVADAGSQDRALELLPSTARTTLIRCQGLSSQHILLVTRKVVAGLRRDSESERRRESASTRRRGCERVTLQMSA
jgi:hypothetical protein